MVAVPAADRDYEVNAGTRKTKQEKAKAKAKKQKQSIRCDHTS
jgi:hypothetical protein